MRTKILQREDLAEIVRTAQDEGKVVVFTNGCFDLLHIGHVRYLEEAKELGDLLIVGINSDSSVRRLKGDGRPFVPQEERAEIISALGCVDFVTIFEEDTPEELLRLLKPDWHVKGGDYKPSEIPEASVVKEYGGKVKVLSWVPNHSTSKLAENLLKK
jgi:rfaE bifunctional protein nucleotidyltransferase chain/domain